MNKQVLRRRNKRLRAFCVIADFKNNHRSLQATVIQLKLLGYGSRDVLYMIRRVCGTL